MSKTATRITEVGRVIVPVSDQDRAVDFYVDVLGFEKRLDVPYGHGERWVEVGPPGGATSIALIPPMDGGEVGVDTRVSLTSADIDADFADLRARGVETDSEVMRWGDPVPPMFTFRDQDGNRLLVVELG